MGEWLRLAFAAAVVRGAIRLAGMVGTMLPVLNRGSSLASGDLGALRALQIVLTYLVPYGFATYSVAEAVRRVPAK